MTKQRRLLKFLIWFVFFGQVMVLSDQLVNHSYGSNIDYIEIFNNDKFESEKSENESLDDEFKISSTKARVNNLQAIQDLPASAAFNSTFTSEIINPPPERFAI